MIGSIRRTIVSALYLVAIACEVPAQAQIVPDGTTNSLVAPNGNSFVIDEGTAVGQNLFHSFFEFSIPTGSEAFFNNALSVENIITRVTGGKISDIDGLIRANGSANLFLLNPNGIVFGPNARLDIGGSFLGTTANSIVFENGEQFSASDPAAPPLLTINVPVGLQFNGQAREIRVRGEGHRFTSDDPVFAPVVGENNRLGLQVNPGNTLAFVGGDVLLDGATLTAAGGRIELGAVEEGFVSLTALLAASGVESPFPESYQWHLDYEGISRFREVSLVQQAALDASGTGIGSMQIVGGQIMLSDGSIALLQNQGNQTFGSLRVKASESLSLTGGNPDGLIASGFRQETVSVGNAGNIEIATRQLEVREGGQIFNRTQGEGNAGDIDVRANEFIELNGTSLLNPLAASLISTGSFGMGSAGDIVISTRHLSVRRGGVLSSGTFGAGSAGNLIVNASESIEVIGVEPRINSTSIIGSSSLGRGNAGSLIINTSRATVRDGGAIGSGVLASGNSGRVVVNATELVEVSGTTPGSMIPSSISASATLVDEVTQQALRLPPIPSGSPGDLEINTSQLNVKDGGEVSVSNDGTGSAGNLQVNAETILLEAGGEITASTRSGEGGNIALQVQDSLQLHDRSQISAEAGGTGNGGNIAIGANIIALVEASRITANAFEGNGGNISIATRGIFPSANSSVTASSQFGVDGPIEINNPEVDSAAGLVDLQKNTIAPNSLIVAVCAIAQGNSLIVTGRGGLPPNPSRQLTGDRPWADLRDLSAFRGEVGKNISPETVAHVEGAIVEANAWRVNEQGEIELVAVLEANHPGVSSLPPNCAAN